MKLQPLLPTITLLIAIILLVGGFLIFSPFDNANANEAPTEKEPAITSLPVVPKNNNPTSPSTSTTNTTTAQPTTVSNSSGTVSPTTGTTQQTTTTTGTTNPAAAPSTTTGNATAPTPIAPSISPIQGEAITENGKTSSGTTNTNPAPAKTSTTNTTPAKTQDLKFSETPRSGGIEIAIGIFVAITLAGGIYYYKNHGDSKQVLKTVEGKLPKSKSRRK
jgi:uncharacterized membrane protein